MSILFISFRVPVKQIPKLLLNMHLLKCFVWTIVISDSRADAVILPLVIGQGWSSHHANISSLMRTMMKSTFQHQNRLANTSSTRARKTAGQSTVDNGSRQRRHFKTLCYTFKIFGIYQIYFKTRETVTIL